MTTFDPAKPVQTRDGRKVRIICTDAKITTSFPIVALIEEPSGFEQINFYTARGTVNFIKSSQNKSDLINVPEEKWIIVGKHPTDRAVGLICLFYFSSLKEAQEYYNNNKLTLITEFNKHFVIDYVQLST